MWWSSAVNFSVDLSLAACRTRSSPGDTLSRRGVRCVPAWPAFPLAPALGSIDAAAGCPTAFADFPATTTGPDFSCPCIIGFGPPAFPMRTRDLAIDGRAGDLPVPAQGASVHAGVSDHAGPDRHSRWRARPCGLPHTSTASAPRCRNCRGSMAGLHAPLSTLRRAPHGAPRMTRGRCGSLLLHRVGLAPTTPCRSPGALRTFLDAIRDFPHAEERPQGSSRSTHSVDAGPGSLLSAILLHAPLRGYRPAFFAWSLVKFPRPACEERESLTLRDRMPGEVLEHAHQPRMVPALAAECRGGVEQFLGRRGIGQREAERTCPLEREVQILLVQFDAEAWVEGALDHSLAMDFEDA